MNDFVTMNRIAPHDIFTEQGLLHIMLSSPDLVKIISGKIDQADFYREGHQLIFEAICSVEDVDLFSVRDYLTQKGKYELIGGDEYLGSLVDFNYSKRSYKGAVELLKDRSKKRQIIMQCMAIQDHCFSNYELEEVEPNIKDLAEIANRTEYNNQFEPSDLAHRMLESILDGKGRAGYTLGIEQLDMHMRLERKTVTVIAAESGVGKSALCFQISKHVSKTQDGLVLYFTLESSDEAIALRLIANESKIPLTTLKRKNVEGQEDRIYKACNELAQGNLRIIDDTQFCQYRKLESFCHQMAIDNRISMVVIDFLQNMEEPGAQSRHLELSHITRDVSNLAKDLNVPVIEVSQLTKNANGRPELKNLKESGDIRNNADNILFIYTPDSFPVEYPVEVYLKKGKDTGNFSEFLNFNGNFQEFTAGSEDQFNIAKACKTTPTFNKGFGG